MTAMRQLKQQMIHAHPTLSRSIALIGLMGAGKSTIGMRLAKELNVDFIDSDAQIEKAAGIKIKDIFELYGEENFRRLEAEEITKIINGKPAIISTGGGTYIHPKTRKIINQKALVVWLKAEPETLASRMSNIESRPLLKGHDPVAKLRELAKARDPIYGEAELIIVTDGLNLTDAAEKVKNQLLAPTAGLMWGNR